MELIVYSFPYVSKFLPIPISLNIVKFSVFENKHYEDPEGLLGLSLK